MFRTSVAAASVLGFAALAVAGLSGSVASAASSPSADTVSTSVKAAAAPSFVKFDMARSANSVKTGCLSKAFATVKVTPGSPVDSLKVFASGLPKNTDFDFFITQVPDAPFGLSWYQGDLESNSSGVAEATYVGRFNEETFSVAPGVAPAPVRHTSPFADAKANPATAPVHQFHLGFWFNSPADAKAAGCGSAVTPFNGEHNAGPQAFSTRNYPAGAGPLGLIKG